MNGIINKLMERIEGNNKNIEKKSMNQNKICEKQSENQKTQKQASNSKIFLKKVFIYLFYNIINLFIIFLYIVVEIFGLNEKYKINFKFILLLLFLLKILIMGILDIKNYFIHKRNNQINIIKNTKTEMSEQEKNKEILNEQQFSTIDSEDKIFETKNNLKSKNARVEINDKIINQSPEKKYENFDTINSSNLDSEREENSLKINQHFDKQLSGILEGYDNNRMNEDYNNKLKRYCFIKIMSHVGYHFLKQRLSKKFNKWKKNVGIKK